MKDRLLISPSGSKVRPTTDKLRSSIFSIMGKRIEGAAVLDAFAGTGAFGIESFSRGAASVVFTDSDTAAVKANVGLLPPSFTFTVKRADFFKALWGEARFDVVFIDPPYGVYKSVDILDAVGERELLKKDGILIYEEFFKTHFFAGDYFCITDERRYGDTTVRFLENK